MAVYRLFRNRAFEPETIATMTSAYADVCRALGLDHGDQPGADAVARKVIEFAQRVEIVFEPQDQCEVKRGRIRVVG